MNQRQLILDHLETYDSITPLEALTRYGIMRLAARVSELKSSGFPISATMKKHNGKKYASYTLGGKPDEQDEQMVLL